MARPLLEICVEDPAGLRAAVAGGADRMELCAALDLGGLTPSAGMMQAAARAGVPVMALIRPRAGDFVWSDAEIAASVADIAAARAAGLAGVVIGAARGDGRLAAEPLTRMRAAAGPMAVTLNRVFDMVPDQPEALELAIGLGIDRVLTSGGAPTAPDGLEALVRLAAQAGGRIGILPGGGITAATVGRILSRLHVSEIHASCRGLAGTVAGGDPLGLRGSGRQTSEEAVRALRAALG